jgi:hypothetical protein
MNAIRNEQHTPIKRNKQTNKQRNRKPILNITTLLTQPSFDADIDRHKTPRNTYRVPIHSRTVLGPNNRAPIRCRIRRVDRHHWDTPASHRPRLGIRRRRDNQYSSSHPRAQDRCALLFRPIYAEGSTHHDNCKSPDIRCVDTPDHRIPRSIRTHPCDDCRDLCSSIPPRDANRSRSRLLRPRRIPSDTYAANNPRPSTRVLHPNLHNTCNWH